MAFSGQNLFKCAFTFVCVIVVGFMMGYWYYKYEVEDRDIGVVDVFTLTEASQIEMPEISLCFANPFINKNLRELNKNMFSDTINRDSYLEYLKGNSFDDQLERINYQNVSLDLNNYFLYLEEQWYNKSFAHDSSLKVENKEIFSGFLFEDFVKCFVLKADIGANRHIKGLRFYYDLEKLFNDWIVHGESEMKIFFKFIYPGQFFLGEDPIYFLLYREHFAFNSWIYDLEIIERRNSENRKCSEDSTSYDKLILEKYLSRTGCKVPYVSYNTSVPRCNMTSSMTNKKLDYFVTETLRIPKACKRILKMRPTFNTLYSDSKRYKTLSFDIVYPKEVKIISQSKEVDLHALIGNIGGYFGLFLGKTSI